jgi:hypothetical protein
MMTMTTTMTMMFVPLRSARGRLPLPVVDDDDIECNDMLLRSASDR